MLTCIHRDRCQVTAEHSLAVMHNFKFPETAGTCFIGMQTGFHLSAEHYRCRVGNRLLWRRSLPVKPFLARQSWLLSRVQSKSQSIMRGTEGFILEGKGKLQPCVKQHLLQAANRSGTLKWACLSFVIVPPLMRTFIITANQWSIIPGYS